MGIDRRLDLPRPVKAGIAGACAAGFLMRSAGTDTSRAPHTGNTRYEAGLQPIPAAALSTIDAAQLARLVALGPVRVKLALDCGWDGEYTSQNVIGEITGSRRLRLEGAVAFRLLRTQG